MNRHDTNRHEILWTLEGLQTVETVMKKLHVTRQSAINLISRLRRDGHVTRWGGGKKLRIYKITMRKQRPRVPGMFDILNKYSPMKLNPWYDHQVHGTYGPEEALIDAIQTKSFRAILASLHLYRHIKDWTKLRRLAKEKDCWQQIGALYEVARRFFRAKRMPHFMNEETHNKKREKRELFKYTHETKMSELIPIARKWQVALPFLRGDFEKVMQ